MVVCCNLVWKARVLKVLFGVIMILDIVYLAVGGIWGWHKCYSEPCLGIGRGVHQMWRLDYGRSLQLIVSAVFVLIVSSLGIRLLNGKGNTTQVAWGLFFGATIACTFYQVAIAIDWVSYNNLIFELGSHDGALVSAMAQWKLRLDKDGTPGVTEVVLASGIETIFVTIATTSFFMAVLFVTISVLMCVWRAHLVDPSALSALSYVGNIGATDGGAYKNFKDEAEF